MNTIGWLFILIAGLLVRQIFRGRVMNLGEDLSDAFIAVVSNDKDALGGVLTRTGEGTTVNLAPATDLPTGSHTPATVGNALLNAAVKRGKSARGYRWAATGPDYYDCSGLVYRACQDLGYKGPRFVTATVAALPQFTRLAAPGVEAPGLKNAGVGDIVCWPASHMGIVSAPGQMYSAMNPKDGIGYAKIAGFHNTAPIYLRFTGWSDATGH